MRSSQKIKVSPPGFLRIALAQHVDFLLVLLPVVLWGGIVYFRLFDSHDPAIDQWFLDRPAWILIPVFLTSCALWLFGRRSRKIRRLLTSGTVVTGTVSGGSKKRRLSRTALPIKTVVNVNYSYNSVKYKKRFHLLSDDGLKPGKRVHIHLDPDKPTTGIIREIYLDDDPL